MVKAEDSILTLESDKATMDVPSPAAGTVKDVKVKVGDKVAQGSLVLLLEVTTATKKPAASVPAISAKAAPTSIPVPISTASVPAAASDL